MSNYTMKITCCKLQVDGISPLVTQWKLQVIPFKHKFFSWITLTKKNSSVKSISLSLKWRIIKPKEETSQANRRRRR